MTSINIDMHFVNSAVSLKGSRVRTTLETRDLLGKLGLNGADQFL
jgi:hypothetical protein